MIASACGEKKEQAEPKNTVPPISKTQNEDKPTPVQPSVTIPKDIPISRALVAKMIALTFNDMKDLAAMDREITFEDTAPDQWYDPFINAVAVQGLMNGNGNKFSPLDPLTIEQAEILISRLLPEEQKLQWTIEIKDKKQPISYNQWLQLYVKYLEQAAGEKTIADNYGIYVKSLIVVGTPGNTQDLEAWNMATDHGIYKFSGFSMDAYIDQQIQALIKDGEMFAFLGVEEKNPTLTNAYVSAVDTTGITIHMGGVERYYGYENGTSNMIGQIVDILLNQGKAEQIKLYQERIHGRIMRVDTDYIELEGQGIVPVWEDVKIYDAEGEKIKWKSATALLVGSDIADFIVKDQKICAAIIQKSVQPTNIRIALQATDLKGFIHDQVEITSDVDFIVQQGEEEKIFSAGEIFQVSSAVNHNFDKYPRIYIKTGTADGKLKVNSMMRGWGDYREHPSYRGIIEVAKQGTGYTIVNELPIEEYLYAVVPSEMPSAHGVEAAKVQAITARSYAYAQFYANRYHQYGGNVDDSTACQVYNNIRENETSIQAVNATKSLGVTYNGNVVSANFFSTSAGYTANSGEVWAHYRTQEFPSYTPPYLAAKKQYDEGKDYGDLTKEENAYAFLTDTNIDSYDKAYNWFRWHVAMSREEIEASINTNLKTRYEASPRLVRTLDDNNIFRSRPIETVGELKDLYVYKRGEGGNIMEMVIMGTEATIKVVTEYNIRFLLRPVQYLKDEKSIILTLADGKEIANNSAMPSAFFVMDKKKSESGDLTSVTFRGGGYGHGVGMSQNGVRGMVDKGYDYEEILQHYYEGTEIKSIY